MRINKVIIQDFKNLKDFEINFDKSKMKTVLLGQNASGKSNFIEAVLLIFKFLDLSTSNKREFPLFSYTINYEIKDNIINIECDHENKNYKININNKTKDETYKSFFSDKSKKEFQPKYVFTYYSGLSNRLKEHFWDHQEKFYEKIIDKDFDEKELDSLRKLFYVQLVHSYFVLLAYFSFEEEEKESIQFLSEVLNIKDIESILFILKKPTWGDRDKEKPNDRFWNANGLVRNFLNFLWENSLAPIYHQETIKTDFREESKQDRLYLYISSKDKLKKLANNYKSNTEFFKALESTYISKLMEEVRIKVKKENADGSITFKELSEGEQQLLTVLGLLKFTKDEDSLILLDEPDTHLNPLWKWKYFEFLDKVVKNPDSTQIIINTHDPLVIGNLTKEEVRIFRRKNITLDVEEPEVDPSGLGVEGILTSELFGLPTTLDQNTLSKLETRNELLVKQQQSSLSLEEKNLLNTIYEELNSLGLSQTFRDPLYQKFIIAYKMRNDLEKKDKYSKEDLIAQNELALEILNELIEEEG